MSQIRDAFHEQETFKVQHELEMRQREEQQRIFRRIDQSRQAPLTQTRDAGQSEKPKQIIHEFDTTDLLTIEESLLGNSGPIRKTKDQGLI